MMEEEIQHNGGEKEFSYIMKSFMQSTNNYE